MELVQESVKRTVGPVGLAKAQRTFTTIETRHAATQKRILCKTCGDKVCVGRCKY